jgi:hypothetical protein
MADTRTDEERRLDTEADDAERHDRDEWRDRYGAGRIKEISRGDWSMGDDGLTERLVLIGQGDRGFYYAVYTSYRGGEDYHFGEGVPWSEEAYETARAADGAAHREIHEEDHMADEVNPGFLENTRQFVAAQADGLKAGATAALRQKAAEIREAIGPGRMEPVTEPERPFGREENGEDVKRVVWTGHTVRTAEGRAYFGAAGLTEGGYYRAAEVQVYGPEELWRWQNERHTEKADAIASAESMSANRLRGEEARLVDAAEPAWREVFGKEQTNMAELPDHLKAKADAATADLNKTEIKMADAGPPVHQLADRYDTKALEAQREQQRQNTLDRKDPEPER